MSPKDRGGGGGGRGSIPGPWTIRLRCDKRGVCALEVDAVARVSRLKSVGGGGGGGGGLHLVVSEVVKVGGGEDEKVDFIFIRFISV